MCRGDRKSSSFVEFQSRFWDFPCKLTIFGAWANFGVFCTHFARASTFGMDSGEFYDVLAEIPKMCFPRTARAISKKKRSGERIVCRGDLKSSSFVEFQPRFGDFPYKFIIFGA